MITSCFDKDLKSHITIDVVGHTNLECYGRNTAQHLCLLASSDVLVFSLAKLKGYLYFFFFLSLYFLVCFDLDEYSTQGIYCGYKEASIESELQIRGGGGGGGGIEDNSNNLFYFSKNVCCDP